MWETSRESYLAAKAAELSKCDQAVKPDQEEWKGKFFAGFCLLGIVKGHWGFAVLNLCGEGENGH